MTYTPRKNVVILKMLRFMVTRMLKMTGWTESSNGQTAADVYGGDAIQAINTMIELSGGKG